MGAKTYRRIAAVRTSMEIILVLSECRTQVAAAEIGARLNLPSGTVLCHLATLEDAGFVRAIGEGWELGMAMAKIWARTKSREETRRLEAERNLAELEIGQ